MPYDRLLKRSDGREVHALIPALQQAVVRLETAQLSRIQDGNARECGGEQVGEGTTLLRPQGSDTRPERRSRRGSRPEPAQPAPVSPDGRARASAESPLIIPGRSRTRTPRGFFAVRPRAAALPVSPAAQCIPRILLPSQSS